MIKNIQDNQDKFSNSCKANLYIKGDFNINFKNQNNTKGLLNSMFDKTTSHDGHYNIYTNKDIGAIKVNSIFVDLKKMKKAAKSIASKNATEYFVGRYKHMQTTQNRLIN